METRRHDGPGQPNRVARLLKDYRAGAQDELPIGGYAALLGAFGLLFAGLIAGLSRKRLLARAYSTSDIALFGIATHKLTRIVTHDWVTIPLRAPFTRYEESAGAGEVTETSRGHGLRRAIGDLARCEFCTGPWVASALLGAALVKPRATRFVATTLAVAAVSDFLHHVYARAKKLSS